MSVNNANKPASFQASKNLVWLLFLSQLANFSLIGQELSLWMLALIGLCLLWRLVLNYRQLQVSSKWLLTLFALSGCTVLAISAQQLGLLLTMIHLLCFAYALKQLELKRRSDFYQLILIALFVLAAAMIFNQTLYFSMLVFAVLVVNITVLIYFFMTNTTLPQVFKMGSKLVLQSVPLAVLLFIIFPRVAPFWQVPLANSAKTGLSDEVRPGDIASLIKSGNLAFRVNFTDNKPLFNQLYWRAIVLDQYDGNSWKKSTASIAQGRAIISGKWQFSPEFSLQDKRLNNTLSYQVIAQPSYQHWLYSLAVPELNSRNANNADALVLPDFTLLNKTAITQALSYQANSYIHAPMNLMLSKYNRARNLFYPTNANPRLVAKALKLRQQFKEDNQLILKVLKDIRQQNYHYTLKPPPLINNNLDQFYFDTKSGFCVHYASSFTFLMRAAGIPARVITGYMGGEYNANGDYYSIYQYDAHAWSEVWLKGKGWIRVDPTAAVSPERVDKGFSQTLFAQQSVLDGNVFSLQNYRNIKWINFFRQQIDALDYQWTRWVIGYTPERQLKLLSNWFGDYKPWQLAILLMFTIGVILAWLWWNNRIKSHKKIRAPWLELYVKALSLLAKQGIVKLKHQSANDFILTVLTKSPENAHFFNCLSENFIRLNYRMLNENERLSTCNEMKENYNQFERKLRSIRFNKKTQHINVEKL
ncbi:MAG: protease [Gammaproteobacteria bacterium]|nr:MAG: protease [Gammaproteobacteria bacterium]